MARGRGDLISIAPALAPVPPTRKTILEPREILEPRRVHRNDAIMRPGMNSKRPRSNRNNARRGSGQGGGRQSHTLDSTGPGMKIRGNPNQIFEKYQALARDAHTAGDRVMEENYAQHAEHYYRLANSEGAGGQQQRQHQQQPRQKLPQPQPETVVNLADMGPAEIASAENVPAEKEATVEPAPQDMAKEPQPVIE